MKLKLQALGIFIICWSAASAKVRALEPIDLITTSLGTLSDQELARLPGKIQSSLKDKTINIQTRYKPQWDKRKKQFFCRNAKGQEGYNRISVEELKRSQNGVCANLEGLVLYGIQLQGANLGLANLKGAYLLDANLRGANLFLAHLESADLRGADLGKAYLTGADLTQAAIGLSPTFNETDLQGAQFSRDTKLPFKAKEALLRNMIQVQE